MSYEQERIDIENKLLDEWPEWQIGYETTAIAWDNIPYTPTPGVPWIRCTILPGNVETLEFGRDTIKSYSGIIDIGVFTPRDLGTSKSREYADRLTAAFNMAEFGTIECDEVEVQNLGVDEAWYHLSVSIPFTRREV